MEAATTKPPDRPGQYLSIWETACHFNVSSSTIRRLIQNDVMPAIRVGGQWRIKKSDIDAYAERKK